MKVSTAYQIVILAGGLGTRLRPLTETVPKPLVEVAGKPYLHWQLLALKLQGYQRVLLLTGYLGEQIEEFFKHGTDYGMKISYSREPEPLGTGGALQFALTQLEEQFFLLNGDSYLPLEFAQMESEFRAKNLQAMIAVYDNHEPTPVPNNLKIVGRQVVEYKKNGGVAAGFNFVDAGVYILNKSLFSEGKPPKENHKFQLEELWPAIIGLSQLGAFSVKDRFYDIGTPERLREFENRIKVLDSSARG